MFSGEILNLASGPQPEKKINKAEAIFMVKFSPKVFSGFMMTINNKNRKK